MRCHLHPALASLLWLGACASAGEDTPAGGSPDAAIHDRDASADDDATPGLPAYAEDGPHALVDRTLDNPGWPARGSGPAQAIHVFMPADASAPAPTVFFCHGYGGTDPAAYQALIGHLVSRGLAVVFVPVPSLPVTDHALRYRVLWAGLSQAVAVHGDSMDLTRVGFMGHSFGAGAVPAMAYAGVVEQGWGSAGAFMLLMAPFYAYDIADSLVAMSNDKLAALPEQMWSIVQVYDGDMTNDHRIAIDLFEHLQLPPGHSAYHNVLVNDDYPVDHAVPTNDNDRGDGVLNGLDRAAVWYVADALADAAFDLSDRAGAVAAVFTADAVAPYVAITTMPEPVEPQSFYRFAFDDPINLRK